MRPLAILSLGAALALSACVWHDDASTDHSAHHAGSAANSAFATIQGRADTTVSGQATFVERAGGGVVVTITLEGAPPGWHAAHVHEHGDCSADDFTSAGGHFNPGGHAHGAPHAMEHHAGDLGNLWVNDDGTGYHVIFMPELTVADGDHSVRGKSIVVHDDADDLVSQPTGDAGGRIGCGEIH